jgi:hypothetical protein
LEHPHRPALRSRLILPKVNHHDRVPRRTLTLRIEVRSKLAAILRMTQGAEQARRAGHDADALAVQIKMVAGAGFEPAAFRL